MPPPTLLSTLALLGAPSDLRKLPPADAFSKSIDAAAAASLNAGKKSCHARDGMDLSGDAAYVWGLNFHVKDAAMPPLRVEH